MLTGPGPFGCSHLRYSGKNPKFREMKRVAAGDDGPLSHSGPPDKCHFNQDRAKARPPDGNETCGERNPAMGKAAPLNVKGKVRLTALPWPLLMRNTPPLRCFHVRLVPTEASGGGRGLGGPRNLQIFKSAWLGLPVRRMSN